VDGFAGSQRRLEGRDLPGPTLEMDDDVSRSTRRRRWIAGRRRVATDSGQEEEVRHTG
jgi:hypothetical protein